MIICCTLFAVRSFAFEVRSWAGNYVPVNLYQVDAILCCDKKGWGHQAQLSLSEVQILAKRRQISAGSSFRARFPYPAQSSLRETGIQPNWPSVSSDCPNGETRFHRLTSQPATAGGLQRQGWGRGSLLLKAWAMASRGP